MGEPKKATPAATDEDVKKLQQELSDTKEVVAQLLLKEAANNV